MEVMDRIKDTELFPEVSAFEKAILFLETSEEKPTPDDVERYLRHYGHIGVLSCIKGIIMAKPQDECYYDAYKESLLKVLRAYGRADLPVLYNVSFGHCEPKCCLPYGAKAQINCKHKSFEILESGCR